MKNENFFLQTKHRLVSKAIKIANVSFILDFFQEKNSNTMLRVDQTVV